MPRGTTSLPLPRTVAAAPFAGLVGQTERAIQGRARDGRLPRAENGEIDLARVVLLGMHAAAEESRGETSGADLDRNKARESLLRGDRLELLNRQLRADLIPADEMDPRIIEAFYRSCLESVKDSMLPMEPSDFLKNHLSEYSCS